MNEEIKKLNELADQWIREHKEELIEEIRGMVRIPSVSKEWEAEENAPFGPECRRMIDYFLERGRAFGFQTRDAHGYAGVISWGNPEEQIGIISHLDVVPVGDGWVYPPFEATYLPEEDALIGRGVDDDKGPAVMGLYLMRMLRDLEIPMKHGIALYGGTSEETGMEDMAQLVKLGEKFPKLSLIPDAGFPVNYAQKGNLNVWLKAPAAGNLKDFRAGGFVMYFGIGRVVKLTRDKAVGNLCRKLLCFGNCALHSLGTFGKHDLRTVGFDQFSAFD